jgi:hypothetical protein
MESRMRMRSAFVALGVAVGLLFAGTAASAESRWFVSGTVDSVDEQARTIELGGNLLHLGVRAEIELAGGVTGRWEDVVARDGEYATALVRTGFRGADEVLTILLEDEIEDGEE